MTALSTSLLRSLLGTQQAAPAAGASQFAGLGGAGAGTSGLNFASLLAAAKGSTLSSDRPVDAAPGVKAQLTGDQLNRIGVAADQAESAGMTNALVMIDGMAVKLDVLDRQVTAVMDPRTAAVTGVDGVLAAPPSSLAAQVSGAGATADPASLAGVLEQRLLARLGSRPAGLVAANALQSILPS